MSEKLKVAVGDHIKGIEPIDGDRVRFIAEDGRTMFEVSVEDGRTILVRAIDVCRVDDAIYKGVLEISPVASNTVEIRTPLYDSIKKREPHD